MAINSGIQNLVSSNRKLSNTDVNNLFYYYYGRSATQDELNYWGDKGKKTAQQLESALRPNAAQFTNAGYYKDVVAPPKQTSSSSSGSQPKQSTPTPQQATLSSPDGKYKVVVNVGSQEASQLQQKGWSLGSGGQQATNVQTAMSYNPSQSNPSPSSPSSSSNKETATTTLGSSAVNHLYQLYLGRDAKQNELNMYMNNPDDTSLRRDLEAARKIEQEKQKATQEQQANAAGAPDQQYNYQFDGDTVLVKFTDDPTPNDEIDDRSTIWLYDRKSQTYRPFASMDALQNYTGKSSAEIMQYVNTLPTTALASKDWSGQFYQRKYAVQDDGNVPADSFNSQTGTGLQTIYGESKQPAEVEEWTGNLIGTIFTSLKLKKDIQEATFNSTVNDATQLARYTNALLYGGYTIDDIYRDVKAKELAAAGNSTYQNFKGFDDTVKAEQWYQTAEGQKSKSDSAIAPASNLDMDMDLFNLSLFKIPGKAFSTIVEPIDWDSPAFKEEAEKIQASWYDIAMQKAEANTEQEKKLADDNWQRFKDVIEKKYGLQLSDNAQGAWNQLQEYFSGYSAKGIGQSGLLNEAMDRYLSDVRKRDEILRESKLDEKDQEQRNYLLQSGTTQQIKEFAAQNPEKAAQWGLIPSDEIKNWFSEANLKSLYPDMSDQQISAVKNMVLDENGYYRSTLYQNLFANKYNLGEEKKTYQESKLYQQKLTEEEKAYAPFTQGNPLSSYVPDYAKDPNASDASNSDNWSINPANQKVSPFVPSSSPAAPAASTNPVSSIVSGSLDSAWENFKKAHPSQDWSSFQAIPNQEAAANYTSIQNPGGNTLYGQPKTAATSAPAATSNAWKAPAGYEAIAHPDAIPNYYSNTVKDPSGKTLYGIPKIKVPTPDYLKLYQPTELEKTGMSYYLKQGVQKRW